jgi:hypothetical protein
MMNKSLLDGTTQILLPTFNLDEVMDTIGKFEEIFYYFPTVRP